MDTKYALFKSKYENVIKYVTGIDMVYVKCKRGRFKLIKPHRLELQFVEIQNKNMTVSEQVCLHL